MESTERSEYCEDSVFEHFYSTTIKSNLGTRSRLEMADPDVLDDAGWPCVSNGPVTDSACYTCEPMSMDSLEANQSVADDQNPVVDSTDLLDFTLSPPSEGKSLQELIETELALRVTSEPPPPSGSDHELEPELTKICESEVSPSNPKNHDLYSYTVQSPDVTASPVHERSADTQYSPTSEGQPDSLSPESPQMEDIISSFSSESQAREGLADSTSPESPIKELIHNPSKEPFCSLLERNTALDSSSQSASPASPVGEAPASPLETPEDGTPSPPGLLPPVTAETPILTHCSSQHENWRVDCDVEPVWSENNPLFVHSEPHTRDDPFGVNIQCDYPTNTDACIEQQSPFVDDPSWEPQIMTDTTDESVTSVVEQGAWKGMKEEVELIEVMQKTMPRGESLVSDLEAASEDSVSLTSSPSSHAETQSDTSSSSSAGDMEQEASQEQAMKKKTTKKKKKTTKKKKSEGKENDYSLTNGHRENEHAKIHTELIAEPDRCTPASREHAEYIEELLTHGTESPAAIISDNDMKVDVNATRVDDSDTREDDLSYINVKELKSSYIATTTEPKTPAREVLAVETGVSISELKNAYMSPTKEVKDSFKEIVKVGASVQTLKETYCSQAARTPEPHQLSPEKEVVTTGISIKELRNSWGDLSHLDDTMPIKDEDVFTGVSVAALRRSYSDLTSLNDESLKRSRDKDIDKINVSVKALRASYGDLTQLGDINSKPLRKSVSTSRLQTELKAKSLGDLSHLTDSTPVKGEGPEIIYTGVSVKALRASYCDLAKLDDYIPQERFNWESQKKINTGVNIDSLRSSFSRFDQEVNKRIHVRSVDAAKVQRQFNKASSGEQKIDMCKLCEKQVFQMEAVKAEKSVWHKNCFRCLECQKQLNLDTYSSHEGELYCKPHFKQLFQPKAVFDDPDIRPRIRKPEMIIRESQPVELPPDVVRASESGKGDYGLEDLGETVNIRSKFEMFESKAQNGYDDSPSSGSVSVKKSDSILLRMKKFQQQNGGDFGVEDDELNGAMYEGSSSEEEEEEVEFDDNGVICSSRKKKERAMSFNKMEDMKSKWEGSHMTRKEELAEIRKKELTSLRASLCMGRHDNLKEMYQNAVHESEIGRVKRTEVDINSEKAKSIREAFEKGEITKAQEEEERRRLLRDDEMSVFEAGTAKRSRNLFRQLDASVSSSPDNVVVMRSNSTRSSDNRRQSREILYGRQHSHDIVRSHEQNEDVEVETRDVASKFKFFENYKPQQKERKKFRITPPREGQEKDESTDQEVFRDSSVTEENDGVIDEVFRSRTTSKFLSMFRDMEEKAGREDICEGLKPLKRFTPPPDYREESETSEEEDDYDDDEDDDEDEEEEEEEDDEDEAVNSSYVRSIDKMKDEFLAQSLPTDRAKSLRAKFERWESDIEKENKRNLLEEEEFQHSLESAKNLKAKFEAMKYTSEQPKEKQRPRVNRFVEIQNSCAETCSICSKRVYAMEKVEASGRLFHKNCFRCSRCSCILRMETYTVNKGRLYCTPHFKQLFISKGNYDRGFDIDEDRIEKKRNKLTGSNHQTYGRHEFGDHVMINGVNGVNEEMV